MENDAIKPTKSVDEIFADYEAAVEENECLQHEVFVLTEALKIIARQAS